SLLHPADAAADGLSTRVVGAVSDPDREIAALKSLRDLDRVEHVLDRHLAYLGGGVRDGAELVLLRLEKVGIDAARADAVQHQSQPLPGAGVQVRKRLGLMLPARTPCSRSRARITGMSLTPLGMSQSTWSATVGVMPVSRKTSPASANFSAVVVAAASWMNLPKRVPVLAKPQDGISIRN